MTQNYPPDNTGQPGSNIPPTDARSPGWGCIWWWWIIALIIILIIWWAWAGFGPRRGNQPAPPPANNPANMNTGTQSTGTQR